MVTASQNSTMLARQDRFPACPPETPGLENRDKRSGRLRHDEAISRISDLAPGKLGYGMTGEQRALYRRELNAYSDCRARPWVRFRGRRNSSSRKRRLDICTTCCVAPVSSLGLE